MSFTAYHQYDGLGLAELVRKKKVSPAELVEEAINRIETHNPKLPPGGSIGKGKALVR